MRLLNQLASLADYMNNRSRTLGWFTLFWAISPLHAANTTVSFDRPYHPQLVCCAYNATESDGTVAVTVVRSGDISASFTVELTTAIIASAGFDYPALVIRGWSHRRGHDGL